MKVIDRVSCPQCEIVLNLSKCARRNITSLCYRLWNVEYEQTWVLLNRLAQTESSPNFKCKVFEILQPKIEFQVIGGDIGVKSYARIRYLHVIIDTLKHTKYIL